MKHEPATVGRKVCKKCGEEKSVLAFASDPTCVDGLLHRCRECSYKLYMRPKYVERKQSGKYKQKPKYTW